MIAKPPRRSSATGSTRPPIAANRPKAASSVGAPFDARYFRRYYESRRTRVYGREEIARLASGVVGLIEWFGGRLDSVLDLGAGTGLWRDWFREHRPKARYRSVDVSPYACETYGHELQDITTFRAKEKFDLVVCQGVLPYLSDRDAAQAIENIAAMSRGFLYLEAVTKRDLEEVCNRSRTDLAMRERTGRWYRARLSKHFEPVGCGLHYVRSGDLVFYELEGGGAGR
jgi:hypothetical protein